MYASDRATCRVAVVDDDAFDRESIVASLSRVLESADILDRVSIEPFYDAHVVARRIEEDDGPSPPWDIVLSDVLMPHPETGRDEEQNGAFFIAATIEEKYFGSEVPVKLAAISNNPGFLASHKLLQKFNTPENASWFHFFVKGEGVTRARNRGHLMSEESWERALLQLIKLRESERWGTQLLRRIDKPVVFLSAGSLDALTKAASIGGNKASLVITLIGETGVGKGVIARLLHYHRQSVHGSVGQFVPYVCSGGTISLIEGDIFGVEESMQRGAIPRQGKLELAAHGTIFFNQIHDLPTEIQNKLIHVIDDRKIPKVGATREIDFEGNLIVGATTARLQSAESGGSFSAELLRRMEASIIEILPLRERREDIPPIADLFLNQLVEGTDVKSRLDDDAREWLVSESLFWPKNLGTLDAIIRQASNWGDRKIIRRSDLEKAADKIASFYREAVDHTGEQDKRRYSMASTVPSDRSESQAVEGLPAEGLVALIMKGGGVKGLAYIGALRELERYYKFTWFIGASAGAITAILLAAGYTTSELEVIMSQKDFRDFLDSKFYKTPINLLTHKGLYHAFAFTDWMDSLLASKLNSPTRVTLSQLPFHATVYASRRGNNALVFDSLDPKTRSISAAYAARCSMAIPFFFTPQLDQGMRVFDGGVRNNYPVDALLRDHPTTGFIGLYLGPENYEGSSKPGSIVGDLLSIWTEAIDVEALEKYRAQTVVIDPRPINTVDFSLTDDEKRFLVAAGRAASLRFLGRINQETINGESDQTLRKRKDELDECLEYVASERQRLTSLRRSRRRTLWLILLASLVLLVVVIWAFLRFVR